MSGGSHRSSATSATPDFRSLFGHVILTSAERQESLEAFFADFRNRGRGPVSVRSPRPRCPHMSYFRRQIHQGLGYTYRHVARRDFTRTGAAARVRAPGAGLVQASPPRRRRPRLAARGLTCLSVRLMAGGARRRLRTGADPGCGREGKISFRAGLISAQLRAKIGTLRQSGFSPFPREQLVPAGHRESHSQCVDGAAGSAERIGRDRQDRPHLIFISCRLNLLCPVSPPGR